MDRFYDHEPILIEFIPQMEYSDGLSLTFTLKDKHVDPFGHCYRGYLLSFCNITAYLSVIDTNSEDLDHLLVEDIKCITASMSYEFIAPAGRVVTIRVTDELVQGNMYYITCEVISNGKLVGSGLVTVKLISRKPLNSRL